MKRYLKQAQGYVGVPDATSTIVTDPEGETVVIVSMRLRDGRLYYLAWIGGEYADSPDEFDELPDDWKPRWKKVK